MELREITGAIIGAATEVHRTLGPGFKPSNYQKALVYELELSGLKVNQYVEIPVNYKGMQVSNDSDNLIIDMIVEDEVVVEIKMLDEINDVCFRRMLSHIRMADKPCGLILNFNVTRLKDGIRNVMNTNNRPEL